MIFDNERFNGFHFYESDDILNPHSRFHSGEAQVNQHLTGRTTSAPVVHSPVTQISVLYDVTIAVFYVTECACKMFIPE